MKVFEKQPADVQDYDINFNRYLTSLSDTGVSFTLASESGVQILSSSLTAGVVKVWIAGGIDGTSCVITVTLSTAGGRSKQAEISIKVKDN